MKFIARLLIVLTAAGLVSVQAAPVPGTAAVSGTVQASQSFAAAQVYFRNREKRMLYMVYTNGGRYRAVALFPGTYEVSVTARGGLQSDIQKVVLKAGETTTVDLTLRASGGGATSSNTESLTFDQIYPAGPALEVLQRTCITCHGPNFLPSKHWNEAQWNAALDLMFGKGGEREAKQRAGTYLASTAEMARDKLSPQERELILPYLVKNFGPGSKTRFVRVVKEMPIDEAKISKSLHIEYYFPADAPGHGTKAPEFEKISARGRWGQAPRFDAEGNVWLTDRGFPNRLVKLDPRTARMTEYITPNPVGGIHDIVIDKEGIIWIPEHFGNERFGKKYVNALDPKTGKWQRYALDPDDVIKTPDGSKWPQSIALDSQGNVYVGWINGGAISRIDKRTKKVTVHIPPTQPVRFYGVVVDKNDNVWSPYHLDGRMAKLDTRTFKWTEYRPPTMGQVRRPNVDAQNNIWFGIYAAGHRPGMLTKLDQKTNRMTEYPMPHENATPYDVCSDPSGNIWIADAGQGGTLITFDPRDGTFTYYPSPQTSDKPKIEITRDGAVWYTPRQSVEDPGFGVLYPDMDRITTLAAYQ